MIEQARITTSLDLFDFDEGGLMANLVTARHEDWTPGDYIAWFPEDPDLWWTWRGMFDVLGMEVLAIHESIGKPVPLWRNPAIWAAHGGHGVVPLYWTLARLTLGRANVPLIAEDVQHGREIERRMTVVTTAPEIHVRVADRRAT